MSKRGYTHIQDMVLVIKAMVSEGMIQREIAEHYGFKDSKVVREALKRDQRKAKKLATGIQPRPKGPLERMDKHQIKIFKRKWNGIGS